MSDKLKRVLDTNLAGLHVTDAQVNAVLRRVSQDEQRPRVIRWQAIAAVLLVLVLGAGVLLQTGILSDDSPQLTADVTRQGDFLTAAQVKKLLASAADLQFSVDEEAISALMMQVEKDGGCSLSTLLEILCPVGSSLGQWDIRAQVALSQTLERIGYQGILPGMTREPLSTEITAQDALARAVAYIRTNDDPQADFTNLDFYRVGIRFLSGVYDGTCEGAYYCVNFDALDAFGTTYEVAVNAEDGSICRMRRERGAGSNHTADEVTRGFRRIFGYDMRAWTPLQLRVYILALSRADRSSMQTVHELFLSVGRDGFPDVPAEALTREDAISFGATGGTGRASGWACDVRKRHPYAMYGKVDFEEVLYDEGDCFARYMVRMREIEQSMDIIEQLIDNIPEGEYQLKMKPVIRIPEGSYYAAVEGSRGEFGVFIESRGEKSPYRMKFRSTGLPLVSCLETIARGTKIADLIAIGGTLDYVVPDIDR